MSLPQLPVPLPNQPLDGYRPEERDVSVLSPTAAFDVVINQRDKFLGRKRCVICGNDDDMVLQPCHIVGQTEQQTWSDLKRRDWIPLQTTKSPKHDPRNGLLLCSNHRLLFDGYSFFLRLLPNIERFVFVNYSGHPELQVFHGKAIALDIKDRLAPFATLFLIHEIRVRGFHPFTPLAPGVPNDTPWQDWIESDGVFDNISRSFKRNSPDNGNSSVTAQPAMTDAGGASSDERTLPLNGVITADVLPTTRVM